MPNRVYKVIELIGTSEVSWEDAARQAIETASRSLSDLRIVEVNKLDMQIEDGKVISYRARLNVSFKYEPKEAWDYREESSPEK
jgi:flavin-binding protein dodecin